jgi:hypothetical protein
MDGLREMEECVPTEVLTKVGDADIGRRIYLSLEIGIVKTPVMGKIGAHEDYVPRPESPHIVSYELSALSSLEMDQFNFCMKMPAIIDVRNEIPTDAERVPGLPGNFKQLRSHCK